MMYKLLLAGGMMTLPVLRTCASDATVPQVPVREWTYSWWMPRFEEKCKAANAVDVPFVFVGDSITHGWERSGAGVWTNNFLTGRYRALNCGFDGDRTEHVLWRIKNGQFGNLRPRAFVLMIGTNNAGQHFRHEEPPVDTIAGVRAVVRELEARYPDSKIVLHALLPRGVDDADEIRQRNEIVNSRIRGLADGRRVAWCDMRKEFVTPTGTLRKDLMPDMLHPNSAGYEIWAAALKPYLEWSLGERECPGDPVVPSETGIAWFHDGRYQRIREEVRQNRSRYFDLVFVGDSISHSWDDVGLEVKLRRFCGLKVLNLGFSGDRVRAAVWNCGEGGLLEGYRARVVSVMIGTNDIEKDSAERIATSIGELLGIIRKRQPDARILLTGILPRGEKPETDLRRKIAAVNGLIRPYADGQKVRWVDLEGKIVNPDGTISKEVLYDFTHPSALGYERWADMLEACLGRH